MSVISKIAKALPIVRQLDADLRAEVEGIRSKIVTLRHEAASIKAGGLSKNDYLTTLFMEIDRIADRALARITDFGEMIGAYKEYEMAIKGPIRPLISRFLDVSSRGKNHATHELERFFSGQHDHGATLYIDFEFLALICRQPMKDALQLAFDRIGEWGTKAVLTGQEAIVRLGEIDAEIERLEAEEAEMIEQASQFGIAI